MRDAHQLFRAIKTLVCVAAIFIVILLCATSAFGQEVYWFPHTPLIDGDDVKGDNSAYDCPLPRAHLYKCMFHGYLDWHWDEGSNTPDQRHEDDGKRIGGAITPRCPPSKPNCSDDEKQVVVVALIVQKSSQARRRR